MTDMRTTFSETKELLTKILEEKLTNKEKKAIRIAMEFAYASAYCSRTCDMNESWYSADTYDNDYHHLLRLTWSE